MTISPTGNNHHLFFAGKIKRKGAFSFIEVMVTIGILSFGLVLIYKAFFLSLNYLHHLNCRFYAVNFLDSKIARLQKILELKKDLRLGDRETSDKVLVDHRTVDFIFRSNFNSVEGINNLYRADVSLSWREGAKDIRIARSAYLTAYNPIKK